MELPAPSQEDPEIQKWWDQYFEADGSQRLAMVREKLDGELDESWKEAIFPEAIYEAESKADLSEYVGLLERLAAEHPDIYSEDLHWFQRSRISHYLASGEQDKILTTIQQDAASMTKTGEAFYGTVSMLRLADQTDAADTLANAGLRVIDSEQLMPWARQEIFLFVLFRHLRQCASAGGTPEAIAIMEAEAEKIDAVMDDEAVEARREMVVRLTGETKTQWVGNQLLGASNKSGHNRYLLSFEFARWLSEQHGIPEIAACELRGLIMQTFSDNGISMKDYFDGISRFELDRTLAKFFNLLCLDQFKAPATLIAVDYFALFLSDIGLGKPNALKKSRQVVSEIEEQLRKLLGSEWGKHSFLDSLRRSD